MRAVFIDCTSELRSVIERRKLHVPETVQINFGSPTAGELVALCTGADVIFTEHTVVPPAVFDACPTVRAVIFMGTGAGTYIDMADAARRGVSVATTGYGDRAVAEHAFSLMFAAAPPSPGWIATSAPASGCREEACNCRAARWPSSALAGSAPHSLKWPVRSA